MNPIVRSLFALSLVTGLAGSASAQTPAADLELWRLDCGEIAFRDLSFFSDTFAYAGESRVLTDSCYLIRHGSDYLLWDTGLPTALLGAKIDPAAPLSPTLKVSLVDQLAQIGVKPDQIGRLGISHNHFDHVGQAASFPAATLMIGAADLAQFKQTPLPFAVDPAFLKPWLEGDSKVDAVTGDRDVFGDGSVTILSTPGHTPGETSLLVKLKETGPVLLSGDVVHFEAQRENRGVPAFNFDRAQSLASMERLDGIAKSLKATLVIQHDPDSIARLPAFPASAK
ncbi:N-acyl homoserine lactonase family protein [Rhizobium sp. YIM 134829]|uniref:N-acyl homoserine lactonase family protein n=1 Tax=Rhizobium sp. YIM 134829 TaxID=3390453 RepID=UPI00397CD53F